MRYNLRKHEKPAKVLVYTLALVSTFVYIGYRLIYTVPFGLRPVDVIFGVLVILLEIIESIDFVIYFFNTLILSKKSPKTPKIKIEKWPDVDVFIATINESEELLSQTIAACLSMEYPGKMHVFVCDDGKRDNIAGLAKKMKVGYITRKGHYAAKAGNYNHALSETKSELIATFDADMRPTKDFLIKTVPFFVKYEDVGFVQTPQSFDNPDIFQARLGAKMPFEQDYFYHHVQMARNNNNSTILCGTNCVVSREALNEVDGYAEKSIAEDVATGMLIEAAGYRGIAISDVLAHGIAVDNLTGFLKQRSRWGRGCLQTLKNYGIFRQKGLSFRQKVDYFTSINYWLFSIKRFAFLILPLLFAFFGIVVVKCDLAVFIPIFLIQYVFKKFIIDLLEGRKRSSTWSKIQELTLVPLMMFEIVREIFGFGSMKFEVTDKKSRSNKGAIDRKMLLYHTTLFALSGFGLGLAVYKANAIGIENYVLPLMWLTANVLYMFVVILFDVRKNRTPSDFRPNAVEKYSLKSYVYMLRRGK